MSVETLDFLFPFFVLGYGAIVTFVLHAPFLERAEKQLPQEWISQLHTHRYLALICLVIGGIWSLQNIWFR